MHIQVGPRTKGVSSIVILGESLFCLFLLFGLFCFVNVNMYSNVFAMWGRVASVWMLARARLRCNNATCLCHLGASWNKSTDCKLNTLLTRNSWQAATV